MADEPRLSQRAEQLLANFPVPERDWEAQARAVEARLAATASGSTEARWLEAPLPEEAADPDIAAQAGNPTDTPFPFDSMPSIIEAPASRPEGAAAPAASAASATPVPNSGSSQSLSALARSVAQKSRHAQSRDIARESLAAAAAARSHNDGMAERVRNARPTPPPPPSQRPAPPQREPGAAIPSAAPANNNLGPWIAVGGLSMVAAVALWVVARPAQPSALQASAEAPAVVAARQAPPPPAEAAPLAEKRAQPEAEAVLPTSPATAAEAASTPTLAASALPLAPRLAAAAPVAAVRAESANAKAAPAAAPASSVASTSRPAPETIVLDDSAAIGKLAAKGGSAQQAATALRPAAGSPAGGLPDRPSTGAVQAAVGGVMGAARACVAGGAPTPAQVTFGSSGTVQSVTVSGPNAGTASASCIDAALRRARVAPFASPTFTLMVWVRP